METDLDTSITIEREAGEQVDTYTITPSGATDTNYTVNFVTNTFQITAKNISVSLTAEDKEYDGTTTTTVGTASLVGVETGDVVSIDQTPTAFNFATANIGTGIAVTATGNYTITGAEAANYSLTQPTLSADITQDNDIDNDGTPNDQDADMDGDGQSNTDEIACSSDPMDASSMALDTDEDQIPDCVDTDDDNDQIPDDNDQEPLVPFSPNGDEDSDGIPNQEEDTNGDGNLFNDDCDNDGTPDFLDTDACTISKKDISTAITPNSDGINDTWVIKGIENFPNSTVKVYNRSGHEVFGAQGYQNNWNAIYKGRSNTLPAGSYYFVINLGDGSIPMNGWLFINY